jgi:molecular chaperone GrpE
VSPTPYDQLIAEALDAVERHEAALPAPAPVPAPTPAPAAARLLEAAPLRGELEHAARALSAAEERARQAELEVAELREQRLRDAADLDNARKRLVREREEAERYANERLVRALLPALDGLDLALATAGDHPLRTGIELTRRLFEDALARFGVQGFSARGEPFDPRRHEAMAAVESAAHAPGTVVEEQQRGFLLHDRLIRPARVTVAAAPPPPASGSR